jgi:hypothetical protein
VSSLTLLQDDVLIAEVIERATDYDRWEAQVAQTGYCHHPIRLQGRIHRVDKATGETVGETYSTDSEPDQTLLIACGNRRASQCPSCSATYKADALQLVRAGIRGGSKGMPETTKEHPMVFATLTAPSFGAVHHRSEGRTSPCRPRRRGSCPHGVPHSCWQRHAEDDPCLGTPICPECFRYEELVLWNHLAPELWRRTTIYLRRELAFLTGIREAELERLVYPQFFKVAEYQRRGAVHFHAVIRLDATPPPEDPSAVAPPPPEFTTALLEEALRGAVAKVRAPCPPLAEGTPERSVGWGEELHIRRIVPEGLGELNAQVVAFYVAKYASKSSEIYGGLDRRLRSLDRARLAEVSPHVARLIETAWMLGARPHLQELRLRQWAHALGFGGHWSTKSRRYSTTLGALRRARVEYAKRRRRALKDAVPLGVEEEPEDPDCVAVASWRCMGFGYRTTGETWLALSMAAWARERKQMARLEVYGRVA